MRSAGALCIISGSMPTVRRRLCECDGRLLQDRITHHRWNPGPEWTGDAFTYTHSYGYIHGDTITNTDGYGDSYRYAYRSTHTHTYAYTTPCLNYAFSVGSGSIVPGTTDTGNHVDDGATVIALPFSYTLYDQSFDMSRLAPTATSPSERPTTASA